MFWCVNGMDIPRAVRLRAESQGAAGSEWIARLPEMVSALSSEWGLDTGAVLTGGTESLVMEVTRRDGVAAVLKIGLLPTCDCAAEARILRLAKGRGYAKFLSVSKEHNALLTERLGASLADSGLTTDRQIRVICQTLRESWQSLPDPGQLTSGFDKAGWLADFITRTWEELDRPCARNTIELALDFARQRREAHDPARCVLAHGDAHANNTLQQLGSDTAYKFVDPDGLYAEPALDLAVPMREWNGELLSGSTTTLARERCRLLSDLTDVAATAIWQWGFVERVSTGLHALEIGMTDEAAQFLRVADILASGAPQASSPAPRSSGSRLTRRSS